VGTLVWTPVGTLVWTPVGTLIHGYILRIIFFII